jgi:hypothetical protein
MGFCCGGEDETEKRAMNDRRCTDMICLIIFTIICGGVMGLGIYAFATGNIDQIIYPADYNGNYCGKPGTSLSERPYAFYPQLDKDLIAQYDVVITGYWWNFVPYTLCVSKCPGVFSFSDNAIYGGCSYPGAECASGTVSIAPPAPPSFYSGFKHTSMLSRCFPIIESGGAETQALCALPNCSTAEKTCVEVENEPLVAWSVETKDDEALCERVITKVTTVVFKPEEQNDDSSRLTQEFASYVNTVYVFTRSLEKGLHAMITMSVLGPILMGFVWVFLLWLLAGFIVWFALLSVVAMLVVVTVVCYIKAGWVVGALKDAFNVSIYDAVGVNEDTYSDILTSEHTDAYGVMAIIMTIVTALVVVMLIMWRRCIKRCIAIVRESTKVFRTIPMLIPWPLVTIAFLSAVLTWGVMVPFYIFYGDVETYYDSYAAVVDALAEASSGDSDLTDYLKSAEAHKWVMFLIHVFGVIWVVEFVKACAWITMSGAVSWWYFFKDDEDHRETFPVINSAKRVGRYHLGSAAFGAGIIAVCQFIRYMLATLDYYTKDLQDQNFLYKVAIKCAQCAMWCLKQTIEFVSYYGFVYIAMDGYAFCPACRKTFGFLMVPKHAVQTAVNKTVEKIIVVIIAWTTPTFCALICYAWLNGDSSYAAENNALYPAIITWGLAFFLSESIAAVFECTIDTIFLCSFKDEAEYDGKYMSTDMREAFGLDLAEAEATPIVTSGDFEKGQKLAKEKTQKNLHTQSQVEMRP